MTYMKSVHHKLKNYSKELGDIKIYMKRSLLDKALFQLDVFAGREKRDTDVVDMLKRVCN